MITCPNCAKDIADDSVHCGYCGAEVERAGGRKTIMGFGAVTGDALRQAAEEAKAARAAADKAAESEPPPVGTVSDSASSATTEAFESVPDRAEWAATQTDPPADWKSPQVEAEDWSMGASRGVGAERTAPEHDAGIVDDRLRMGEPPPNAELAPAKQGALTAKSKKLIIPLVAIFVIFSGCCIGGALWSLLTP